MINTLLPSVLKMSFNASIVILVVLAARAILCKAPKIFSYLLWSVVLFRLLCPVSFLTHISVLQFTSISGKHIEINGQKVQKSIEKPANTAQIKNIPVNTDASNKINRTLPGIQNPYNKFLLPATIIWITGIAIILIYNAVSLLQLHKHIIAPAQSRSHVVMSGYIPSPFVYGILHPRIYLPSSLLKLATGRKTFTRTFTAFGESRTASRIKHIMNYKKTASVITLISIIILVITFIFAGSNPLQKNQDVVTDSNSNNASADKPNNNTSGKNIQNTGRTGTSGMPFFF